MTYPAIKILRVFGCHYAIGMVIFSSLTTPKSR